MILFYNLKAIFKLNVMITKLGQEGKENALKHKYNRGSERILLYFTHENKLHHIYY